MLPSGCDGENYNDQSCQYHYQIVASGVRFGKSESFMISLPS